MAIIYYNEYIGDDDYGNPMYRESSYDDGSNDTTGEDNSTVTGPATDDVDYSKIYDWNINADGSRAKLNPDGSVGYQDPDGSTYSVKDNIYTTESEGKTWRFDAKQNGFVDAAGKLISNAPSGLFTKMLNAIKANPVAALGTAYAAYKSFSGSDKEGGYNKPIPKLEAVRQQIEYNDPNRRPGATGRQYTTDPRYVAQGDAAGLAAAQAASEAQKQGILAAYTPAAPEVNPYAGKMPTKWNTTAAPTPAASTPAPATGLPALPTKEQLMDPNYKIPMASGGIAMLAKGGEPRYLQGETDGMADEIPSNIDGDQEAALSHGEFVIPADVVSHLGNGNSDAGAKKLYEMMDRIREARTGTKEQGKEINPDKFMPGGLAKAYAAGGAIKGYNGTAGSAVSSGGIPLDTSKTSTLSPWAGDYVTNMLGQADALASTPTATYKGPLTAGASNLQQQGFAGISDIASAGYDPTKFTSGTFDSGAASRYMNPYLSAVLNPQMEELRRQNEITNMGANAKLTQAGAYGGGRQAIMNAENNRNLMQEMNKTVGTGYANAFDKAMAQFNTEQGRQFDVDKASEASRQYSADYGLKTAKDLLDAGATQRGITAEGIAADKRQFEEQQADPYNRLEFKRKMLEGLPIGASTTSVNQDSLSKIQSDIAGLASLYDKLSKLGIKT
jgi:hypothetical protein